MSEKKGQIWYQMVLIKNKKINLNGTLFFWIKYVTLFSCNIQFY